MTVATLKDVLYGLEFLGQELCRWPNPGGRTPAWSLEPGGRNGVKVPHHVADKARENASVVAAPASNFGESRYIWRTPHAPTDKGEA